MTVQKFSQITTSPSNLTSSDYLVGVTAANVDYRFSPAQIGLGITVGTTTITGGTPGDILYDNSGVVGEKTISVALDVIGATQGDILYRDAAAWAVLAPGTSGYVLSTQGAGANPHWITPPTGALTVGSTAISGGVCWRYSLRQRPRHAGGIHQFYIQW